MTAGAPLTVMHLSTALSWRGGENQILLLCLGLRSRGVRNIVAAPGGSALLKRAAEAGLETAAVRIAFEADVLGAGLLAKALKRSGARILHAHDSRGVLPAGFAAAWARGAKVIAHRRTSFGVRGAWKYRRCADMVIAISRASREELIRAGVPESRIRVVYSGLEPPATACGRPEAARARRRIRKALGIPDGRVATLCVASLTEEKDHATLMRALEQTKEPRPLLLLAGSGAMEEALKAQAEGMGLSSDVRFLGFRRSVSNLMWAADIFAIASTNEGLCTSLVDAQMHSLAAIATRAGGMPEVVEDGRTGLLVPIGDAPAFAAALARLSSEAETRRQMGEAGRERAARLFSSEATVEGTLRAYREIAGIRP